MNFRESRPSSKVHVFSVHKNTSFAKERYGFQGNRQGAEARLVIYENWSMSFLPETLGLDRLTSDPRNYVS